MDSRRAGRKVLFVCLAFSLCPAVHPATGPSAEGSDATAAIGDATPAELVQELAGRGADGRFIEDLPGRYTFSPLRSE